MSKLTVKLVHDPDWGYNDEPNQHIIMGGDRSNPSWDDYVKGWDEKFRPYLEAIKEYIPDTKFYKGTGGKYCNDYHFEFSDGTEMGFSWRGWGDLMQAIVDKNEGYMAYYM